MPYIKSICIRSTPNRSLAYIANPEKTDNLLLVSGLNCSTVPAVAYLEMKTVFEEYSKHKFNEAVCKNEKTPVKAIHYIQSFRPTDNVSPEQAHAIAKEWAETAFGTERQILVSTHLDKGHIHSHIIINTYDFNGVKFNDNQTTLAAVRSLSDTLCVNYGIQPIRTNKKSRSLKYNEWDNKKKGTSWKQQIRFAIDKLVMNVNSVDELISELEKEGFTVKRGKYLAIRAEGQERFVRTKTLGEDYTEESLSERIRIAAAESGIAKRPKRDINELNSVYYKRIYEVSELVKANKKTPRKYSRKLPYSVQNDFTVYTLAAQLAVINREHISSIGELEGKLNSAKEAYQNAKTELNKLTQNGEQLQTVIVHCEKYFELKAKSELTAAEQLKLKIFSQTVERIHVSDESDIERVRTLKANVDERAAALASEFHDLEERYTTYSEIVKTYYEISQGDYISKLVEQERQRQEKEKEKNHKRSL